MNYQFMSKGIIFIVFYFSLLIGFAQEKRDSVHRLEEVYVYGQSVSRYAVGATTRKIDTQSSASLAGALAKSPSIYFKMYGNDQLSTISFRGTSASQTAVLWHGVNINSPTLGQTDFSLLPTFLLDEIALQPGSSSSQYGSDALGGSVLLSNRLPEFDNGEQYVVEQKIGSFSNYTTGFKSSLSFKRILFRTKILFHDIKNDFRYTSPANGFEKKQNNAAVRQFGFDQQVYFKVNDNGFLGLDALYTATDRHIQPTVTDTNSTDELSETNWRFNVNYSSNQKWGKVYNAIGFINNNQIYNVSAPVISRQLFAITQIDQSLGSAIDVRYGFNSTQFFTDVESYASNLSENRTDFFGSFNYLISRKWKAGFNVRQGFYAEKIAPFTPSLGVEFYAKRDQNQLLKFNAQGGRAYRVPTLNDRYWQPGGNPGLKPEEGINGELGVAWELKKHETNFDLSGNIFFQSISNWISWFPTPQGYWSPQNLANVNAYGAEVISNLEKATTWGKLNFNFNYSYNRSVNLDNLSPNDRFAGSQIPYVPIHLSNVGAKAFLKYWTFTSDFYYRGEVFTSLDNHNSLSPYLLLNIGTSKLWEWDQFTLVTQLEIKNLTNQYFENYENRAMPGINFLVTLNFTFRKLKPINPN